MNGFESSSWLREGCFAFDHAQESFLRLSDTQSHLHDRDPILLDTTSTILEPDGIVLECHVNQTTLEA
jgi:hypothetical protein